MQCRQTERRLHDLLDSRQDIDTDPALREHLEWCRPCATLATAYDLLARAPAHRNAREPMNGLATRVIAQVAAPSPVARRTTWRSWTALAVAASLLIAVGLAMGDRESGQPATPTATTLTERPIAAPQAETKTMVVEATAVKPAATQPTVPGRDMWYRTGQGLASISLAGLRSQRTTTAETESPNDAQLLDRAFDTLRTMWPREGESQNPARGETGWRTPGENVLAA